MNEHSPIIAFDRNLGQHVDYIDVDYDELVTYMQGRGFDNETIATTNIEVHDESNCEYDKTSKETYFILGMYAEETDMINLYPSDRLADYQNGIATLPHMQKMFEESMSGNMNSTLIHELEHKLVKYEGGMSEEKKHQRKKIGREALYVMGAALLFNYSYNTLAEAIDVDTSNLLVSASTIGMSMASAIMVPKFMEKYLPGVKQKMHDEYVNAPEEARCRRASESAPDVMTVKIATKQAEALPEAA